MIKKHNFFILCITLFLLANISCAFATSNYGSASGGGGSGSEHSNSSTSATPNHGSASGGGGTGSEHSFSIPKIYGSASGGGGTGSIDSFEDDYSDDFIDTDDDDDEIAYNAKKNKNKHGASISSSEIGPGITNSINNNSNINTNNIDLSSYGKILANNTTSWFKNLDGTYSLFYIDDISNQPTIAVNGFFSLIDNSAGVLKINTYHFNEKGIMTTTPFIDSNGNTINFTATGEVVR